jgi:hypothetical protein
VAAAAGLLVACGSASGSTADLEEALTVELPGFVSAAARPAPPTLCDPDPAHLELTPPSLPAELGTPAAVYFQTAPTTVEAYAWNAVKADAPDPAQSVVEAAAAATDACDYSLPTESQTVDEWSGSGWTGVRVLRSVPGTEQVQRTLVHSEDVVLLVVLRTDLDDPAALVTADEYLAAVAENLR